MSVPGSAVAERSLSVLDCVGWFVDTIDREDKAVEILAAGVLNAQDLVYMISRVALMDGAQGAGKIHGNRVTIVILQQTQFR